MSKPKYFLYARKSTEDDDRQVMSIEAQLFELREFARRENLEIVEEFQESKSAKTQGREVFGKMMEQVERSDGVGILAWHPDRLARILWMADASSTLLIKRNLRLGAFRHFGLNPPRRGSLCCKWRSDNPSIIRTIYRKTSGAASAKNCAVVSG